MKNLRTLTALSFAAVVVQGAARPTASAQSAATDAASRTLLLEQAQQARGRDAHAEAYALAERAGRIEMTPSVRLFLAQELEALGRFGEALGTGQLCVREAERAANLRLRDEIIGACREIVQRSTPRVGRLTVRVPSPAPDGLVVRVAGNVLGDVFYGVPYVVSPGSVLVEATAPGGRTFRREITVGAGEGASVEVDLSAAVPAVVEPPPSVTPPVPPPLVLAPAPRPSLVGPIVLLSAGAVGLVLAAPLYALREGELGALDAGAGCSTDAAGARSCPATPTNESHLASAGSLNTGLNVALVAGGVLTAAGATWLVVNLVRGPAHRSESARVEAAPALGGASLRVLF